MHSLAQTLQSLLGLERDGSISVIKADRPPRVIDVSVADGAQTVRVKLE